MDLCLQAVIVSLESENISSCQSFIMKAMIFRPSLKKNELLDRFRAAQGLCQLKNGKYSDALASFLLVSFEGIGEFNMVEYIN